MQYITGKNISTLLLLLVLTGMWLTACTNDNDDVVQGAGNPLQVADVTRSGESVFTGAADYSPLRLLLYDETEEEVKNGLFVYTEGGWRSGINVTNGTDYRIYGFAPSTASNSFSIGAIFPTSATLLINNLAVITTNDVCVVTGVQQVSDKTDVKDIVRGQFAFTGREKDHNFVNLQLDHLYAAMQFTFKVTPTYNDLRTIKVKNMVLKTASKTSAYHTLGNVVAVLSDNSADPLNTTWTFYPTTTALSLPIYQSETPLELTETDSEAFGQVCYVPHATVLSELVLETTYDIYDKQGNLIRPDQTATNQLTDVLGGNDRGQLVTLHLTVKPTYLYVLSDPDLDNPTMEIDN